MNASPYPAFSIQSQISGPLEEQRSCITTFHVRNVTLGYLHIYSLIFTICKLAPPPNTHHVLTIMADDKKVQAKRVGAENGVYVPFAFNGHTN